MIQIVKKQENTPVFSRLCLLTCFIYVYNISVKLHLISLLLAEVIKETHAGDVGKVVNNNMNRLLNLGIF